MSSKICGAFLFALVLMVGVIFFPRDDTPTALEEGVGGVSMTLNVSRVDSESSAITRASMDQVEKSPLYWKNLPDLAASFQLKFNENYVNNGGEETAIQLVLNRTKEQKSKGNWENVPDALASMEANGMAFSNKASRLFEDVLFAEHYHVAGLLYRQTVAWRKWESEREQKGYYFPHDEMERVPLCFSPEMHFSSMTEHAFGEYSPELWLEAADLRDRLVRESASIELERFLMLGSIQKTIRDLKIDIPDREWDEAVSSLLPGYQNVLEAARGIEQRYISGLSTLLIENGYEVKRY